MLRKLRLKLTLWFVCLVLLLYALGSAIALLMFHGGLVASMDRNLGRLSTEVLPSVKVLNGQPSLVDWDQAARENNLQFLFTVQLFDRQGKLLEQYGQSGVPILGTGTLRSMTRRTKTTVMSRFVPLAAGGYLQVQITTKNLEDTMKEFAMSMLAMAPLLAIATGICGYWFSGKAVRPIADTMDLLRRFVADAGHEFNTPVSVIEASVQTLEQTLRDHDISTEVLDVITRASARMKNLSSNLMLLARVENPEMGMITTRMSLKDIVGPVIDEFQELCKSRDIHLICKEVPAVNLQGNRDSLHRMLANLVDNAIRYTEPGGTVTVSLSSEDTDVAISVQDTGIGIPSDSMDHIFERFYRVDKSRARSAGGSGLGLSIVKAIAEAHNGKVTAYSQPGQGSNFTIVLPRTD